VAQSFLYPSTLGDVMGRRRTVGLRERNAYVIRNSRLDPDWASVDRRIFTIAGRAIATMIHYSGHNDILRMQATAERDGVAFNLAYIGPDFTLERRESFDPDYMRALFDHGHRLARAGYPYGAAAIRCATPRRAWRRRRGRCDLPRPIPGRRARCRP
jgi:hypothetical protein